MNIYEFDPDDARRFGQEQGIVTRKRGNELHFDRCPYCRNKTDDKNTFAISLRTGQFKCLRASCGAHGNMITLARDFNFSLGTTVDEYFNRRKRYRDLSRYPKASRHGSRRATESLHGKTLITCSCSRLSMRRARCNL